MTEVNFTMAMIERQEESTSNDRVKSLSLVAPELNAALLAELGALHLHPYDIQAGIAMEKSGVRLTLRYGEELAYCSERLFDGMDIPIPTDQAVKDFFREAADNCKKVLMAEYYKWMKP